VNIGKARAKQRVGGKNRQPGKAPGAARSVPQSGGNRKMKGNDPKGISQ
jgi:hypothetical protein